MAMSEQEILYEIKKAAWLMRAQAKNSHKKRIDYLPPIQPYSSLNRWKLKNEDNTFFKPANEHLSRDEIIEKCCTLLNTQDYKYEAAFVKHFFIQNQQFIDEFIRLNKEYDVLLCQARDRASLTETEIKTLDEKSKALSLLQATIRDKALAMFNDANLISDTAENLNGAFAALLITACILGGLGLVGALAPAVAAGIYTAMIDAIPAMIGVALTMLLFIPALCSDAPRDPFTEQTHAAAISACFAATIIMTYELWNIMFPAILSTVPALSIGIGVIGGASLLASGISKFFAARYESESDQKFEAKLDKALKAYFQPSDENDQELKDSSFALSLSRTMV